MQKAISALDLNVECEINYGLKTRVLYDKTPFTLAYDIADYRIQSFCSNVEVDESGNSGLMVFEYSLPNGEESVIDQPFEFGKKFTNGLGSFTLSKTEEFNYFTEGDSALSRKYLLNYKSDDVLTSGYMSRLSVTEAREKSSILRLTLPNQVPTRGVDILNMILSVYIQENIEKKNQLASNSLRFIDRQLNDITTELDSLEGDIKRFKMTKGVSDISSEASFFLEQVGSLDKTVSEIDVKLSIIDYLADYIDSNKDLKNASPSSLGIEDPLLQQLISTLSELTSERESMLRFTKADNPLVNSIDSKIEEARESLKKNIASIRNGLVASKEEVQKQLGKIEESNQSAKSRVRVASLTKTVRS